MTLVHRMIARRIIATSATVFAVLIALAATTQILNQVFRIIDASGGLGVVLQFLLLFLPKVTAVTLPLAWLVGVMAASDSLRENNESVILAGTGRTPLYALRPAVWLTGAVTGLMLVSSVVLEPAANRRLFDLILSLQYEALTVVTGDSVLREIEPGLFVRGGPRGPDGEIRGFLLYDRREPPSETIYVAETVHLGRDARGVPEVEMLNGRLLVSAGPGASYSANFGSYRFTTEYFFSELDAEYRPRERRTGALLADARQGSEDERVWSELRRRLTDWLYPIPFCAIAAWVAIQADLAGRGRDLGRRWTMAAAIALAALVRVAGLVLPGSMAPGWAALWLGVAIPLGAAVLFAALAVGRTRRLPRRARAAG